MDSEALHVAFRAKEGRQGVRDSKREEGQGAVMGAEALRVAFQARGSKRGEGWVVMGVENPASRVSSKGGKEVVEG